MKPWQGFFYVIVICYGGGRVVLTICLQKGGAVYPLPNLNEKNKFTAKTVPENEDDLEWHCQ